MPHLHVVVIRLPWRSATGASWAFVGRQRPPKTAGPRPQSVIRRGRRPTAHSPPVVTTRQRISSCHSTARSRRHPRAGTANTAHISPDQSPSTHPAGLRRTSCAEIRVSYTFGKDATFTIWIAAIYGDAIAMICSSLVPDWAGPICDLIQYSASVIVNLGEPGYHDCLQAYIDIAWPPVGVRYVYC